MAGGATGADVETESSAACETAVIAAVPTIQIKITAMNPDRRVFIKYSLPVEN
jgi:hypothetical protein